MPTYDYECKSCKHRFEVRQGFHDDRVAYCPLCSQSAERQISLVPVIFKGSGWYVTDSREGTEKSKYKEDGKPPEKPQDSKPVKTDNASKKTPDPAKSNSSDTPSSSSPSNGDS